jgi:hypothetical protein
MTRFKYHAYSFLITAIGVIASLGTGFRGT